MAPVQGFGKAGRVPVAPSQSRPLRSKLSDKRRQSRQRMVSPGKLWCGLQARPVDCVIGDASTGGARVRVKNGETLPNEVFLIHLCQWTAYKARVAWRRPDGNFGLVFKKSFDLKGAIAPELKAMRDYCVAFDYAKQR